MKITCSKKLTASTRPVRVSSDMRLQLMNFKSHSDPVSTALVDELLMLRRSFNKQSSEKFGISWLTMPIFMSVGSVPITAKVIHSWMVGRNSSTIVNLLKHT